MKGLLLLCCCGLPLKHFTITSKFGFRIHPITRQHTFHNGIDLSGKRDTVYAVMDGNAIMGYDVLSGFYIMISDGHLACTYCHLSQLLISAGPVVSGQPIGITGATGRVTGAHLHLSISYDGIPIDPLKFLYQFILKSNNHEY